MAGITNEKEKPAPHPTTAAADPNPPSAPLGGVTHLAYVCTFQGSGVRGGASSADDAGPFGSPAGSGFRATDVLAIARA